MYIYESHMGGVYASYDILDYEDRYCEQCGDSDWFLGYADTKEEAWDLLKDDTNTFDETLCKNCTHLDDYDYCNECENWLNSGGWDYDYIQDFINTNWDE